MDIDHQATEVAQMSLLLKLLENENLFTAHTKGPVQTTMMVADKILPTLSDNIKSGNSLIGTDYTFQTELAFDDYEQQRKINVFDFEPSFPKVFRRGGFDAIVGNPPYLKELGSKELFQTIAKGDFGKKYYQGKMDFWYFFIHRGIEKLRQGGYLAFITNSYWMKSDAASKMIEHIQKELIIDEIVDFDDYKVFEDVSGKHNISIFIKGKNDKHKCRYYTIDKLNPHTEIQNYNLSLIENGNLIKNNKLIISNDISLFDNCDKIDNHFEVSQGVVEATDKITKKHKSNTKNPNVNIGDGVFVLNTNEIKNLKFNAAEKKLLKPYVNTNHIGRYENKFNNEFLLYLGKKEREDISNGKYPNVKLHLDNMAEFITSSNLPYGIHRTREQKYFESPKLICKGMFLKPSFHYDDEKYYCGFSFSVIIQKSNKFELKTLLALMNSKVGEYWFNLNGKKRGIGVDIGVLVFREFPIPREISKENEEKLIQYVDRMLELKKQEQTTLSDSHKESIANQIKSTDYHIDKLVYELYGLSEEEIKVVEG